MADKRDRRQRRRYVAINATEALGFVSNEAAVLAVFASDLRAGRKLTNKEVDRAVLAASRISRLYLEVRGGL
jgi:hypothetical protein